MGGYKAETWIRGKKGAKKIGDVNFDRTIQTFARHNNEPNIFIADLDERTSSLVSPGPSEFLVFLVFLAPSIGKSRQLGCQYLGHLGLKYLSSL